MKKQGKSALLAGVLICCAAFGAYRAVRSRGEDSDPPVITVPQDTLRVSVGADHAALLEGITAADPQDGDVSASLLVESVSGMTEEHCATVTVAAFDEAGNVARAQRRVEYTDYTAPHFTLSEALIFREGTNIDPFTRIGAQDAVDGTLDDRVKGTLLDGGTAITAAGLYTVEFRVTNSLGDTAYLKVPVEVCRADAAAAQVTLSDWIVYLERGAPFDAQAYLQSLTIGSRSYALAPLPDGCAVEIESDVDPDTPGIYAVTYTVTMDGCTGFTRLVAVVEE